MKLEEIRLTEEELIEAYSKLHFENDTIYTHDRGIANRATDKAIREILKGLNDVALLNKGNIDFFIALKDYLIDLEKLLEVKP